VSRLERLSVPGGDDAPDAELGESRTFAAIELMDKAAPVAVRGRILTESQQVGPAQLVLVRRGSQTSARTDALLTGKESLS
jgi:hypothetical protein